MEIPCRTRPCLNGTPCCRPSAPAGSLDGIETGIRQLIREEPLETEEVEVAGDKLLLPSKAEMLRIKAVLILKRNATRDYLDTVAMFDLLGPEAALTALSDFDRLYPQPNGWVLAYAQWRDRLRFAKILEAVPVNQVVAMYYPYHEASEDKFADYVIDRIRALPRISVLAHIRRE